MKTLAILQAAGGFARLSTIGMVSNDMHPLFGADLGTLIRVIRQNGPVSPAHLPMMCLAVLSAVGRTPFRLGERASVARRRRHAPPMPAPVFIIGHWRSGTTHLYNILSKGGFGYVSPFAAGMPLEYQTLGRWLRPLLAGLLPKTRYVDQVVVRPDSPQEDEIPLGSIAPISFYHGVYFPRHFEHHLERSFFLDHCGDDEITEWEEAFCHFLDKLWLEHGQRLLIKNPAYSARVPQLRRLFPEARFIHIYRNPHDVFRSTRRFYQTLIEKFAWQTPGTLDLDRIVMDGYRRMMRRIAEDTECLPGDQFAALSFEDLERQPLVEIERLYRELGLGDFARSREAFERYLKTVRGFEKTQIPDRIDDREMVERQCKDLLERFGYAAETP